MRLHKGFGLQCGRQALLCHTMHRRQQQQPIRTLLYLTGLQSKSINALCFLPYFRTTPAVLYFGLIHKQFHKRGMLLLEPFCSTYIHIIYPYNHTSKIAMIFALRMTIDTILYCFDLHSETGTTDTQRELFFENLKLLGFGRQIRPKIYGAFGVFSADLSARILVL